MSTTRLATNLMTLSLLVSACSGGGPDKGYGAARQPTAQEQGSIDGLVAAAGDMSRLSENPTGDTAFGHISGMYGFQSELLLSKWAESYERRLPAELPADGGECGVVSADGRTVTYSDCEFGGIYIDGQVSWREQDGGIAYETDLTMSVAEAGMTMYMGGTLLVTENRIRTLSNLVFDVSIDVDGYSARVLIESEWDVALSDGCPVGGFVELHGEIEGAGYSDSDLWIMVEFGPGCGQATIR